MALREGTNGSDTLTGTMLSDDIYGYDGSDQLNGGFGEDWLYGGGGSDLLNGGFQNDRLYGENGNDTLNGGDGEDYFLGGAGADQMQGGAGDDTFDQTNLVDVPGDRIVGGAGLDLLRLHFAAVAGPVNFAIQDPTVTVTLRFGTAAAFSFREIEVFEISGSIYADRLTGWLNDDTLDGGAGADTLVGGQGNDLLSGDDGNDRLLGGGGDDLLYGDTGNDVLSGDVGDDALQGGAGNDAINGGVGNDDIEGDAGSDRLYGGTGNDLLSSDAYFADDDRIRDMLFGEAGSDTLSVGINDHAYGGAGIDLVHVDFTEMLGDVAWAFSPALKDFVNGTRVIGTERLNYDGGAARDIITGWNFADEISGNGGADQLSGGGGNDTLDGGAGADLLRGGLGADLLYHDAGNDTLYGDAGNDAFSIGFDELASQPYRVLISGGAGVDTVRFSSYDLGAYVDLVNQAHNNGLAFGKRLNGIEVLEGTAVDDQFFGGVGTDVFRGGSGSDLLAGRAGNDVLMGEAGSDILTGGVGRDIFDFTDYSDYEWEGDTITDFRRGEDVIRLDRSDFGAGLRLVNAMAPNAAGLAPALIYETDTRRLWYDADGAGGIESPRLMMTLTGVGQLALSDFVFI